MRKTEKMQWGWIEHDGAPQHVTFDTAEEALEAMRGRQGRHDLSVEDIARIGFRLGRVRVTVEAAAIMADVAG